MRISPLDQFHLLKIKQLSLFNFNFSITNATISFVMSYIVCMALHYFSTRKLTIKPNKIQMCGELLYCMIRNSLNTNIKEKDIKFIPSILTLFLFILTNNLLAIFPIFFSTTSHICVTMCLSIISFVYIIITGFKNNGLKYLCILLPKGTPKFFSPLMIMIELFAFIARPFSLGIRLAANLTAGHVVLKVLASFILIFKIFGILPFILLTILTCFEIFIAVLQAYTFMILVITYLGEAVHRH